MVARVFHIQRFSLFDGPGVRTVVFLKGCPLRCKWCHNPEGLSYDRQILYDALKCIGCGDCVKVCDRARHIFSEGVHTYLRDGCSGCGKCADACPTCALSIAGKDMTVAEVMAEVRKDRAVYQESGGGITLSGGEPMSHPDFAIGLLKASREEGIHTCIETSGYCATDKLLEAAKYLDTICFDYKATGDAMHKRLCGVEQTPILANLGALCDIGKEVILRCPIVCGMNDTPEHINGIAETAALYDNIREIQLEPYHRLGISKSVKLGLTPDDEGSAPEKGKLEAYTKIITDRCRKKCTVSG